MKTITDYQKLKTELETINLITKKNILTLHLFQYVQVV
jgi:hypothetical protein